MTFFIPEEILVSFRPSFEIYITMSHIHYIQLRKKIEKKKNADVLPNKQNRENEVKKETVSYTQHV